MSAASGKDVEVSVAVYNRPGSPKTYVAEITGTGGKYGLQREFQKPSGGSRSGSGKTGRDRFKLKEGKIYEIAEAYKDKRYVRIENGDAVPVAKPGDRGSTRGGQGAHHNERPTARETALERLEEQAKQAIPTSLPQAWKDELAKAEKYSGLRKVLKNRALNMASTTAIPAEAAIGRMLLEEIRKRGW